MRRLIVFTAAALLLAGCSPPKPVPVSGRVTLDGEDLAEGDIEFVSDNPAFGPEAGKVAQGRFELQARPGKNKVKITATRKLPPKGGFDYFESVIPAKYNEQTELTADVPGEGRSDLLFELKSDKK